MVEPRARVQDALPSAIGVRARVGCHVDRCTGQWQRGAAASETVADLPPGAGSGPVEGFDGSGEVVRLGFQRQHGRDGARDEEIRPVSRSGGELLYGRPGVKGHVVLVGRDKTVRVDGRRALDHCKEAMGLLNAVDDELASENLVAAVLRVDLRESEHFAVGQLAPQSVAQVVQVTHLVVAEGKTFATVVVRDVVDIDDGFGLPSGGEEALVEPVVEAL